MKKERENHPESDRSEYFSQQMKVLRELYRSKFPEKMKRMESLIQELNWDRAGERKIFEIFRLIHSLKGSSGTYGFPLLCRLSMKLEGVLKRAHSGEIPVGDSLVDLLVLWLETVRDKINPLEEEDTTPREAAELMEKLESFAQ